MNRNAIQTVALALGLLAIPPLVAPKPGAAQARLDELVQPPQLSSPGRGSVAGSLASLGFEAETLSRGSVRIPSPFEAPTERGGPLGRVFPDYSPDRGMSEWGMGWGAGATIRRFREVGDLDFATDQFISPWGVLQRGTDGAYYPRGFAQRMRIQEEAGGWVATGADGTRHIFRAADALRTHRGTYEWHLSEVVALTGERTNFEYHERTSFAQRPYVKRVLYGGRGAQRQYQITLTYDRTIGVRSVDYHAGEPVVLDRRVSHVELAMFDPATSSFRTRHSYDLEYQESPAGVAFYLHRVLRTYASGEAGSTFTYDYRFGEEDAQAATLERAEVLDEYLRRWGINGLMPSESSYVDIDRDGRTDLESAFDHELARHTDRGLAFETLPRDGTEDENCRPQPSTDNQPRTLARMNGDDDVHALHAFTSGDRTTLSLCDRQGHGLATHRIDADGWQLGALVRVVDVNRDRHPDVIRVFRGGYELLLNRGDRDALNFHPVRRRSLAMNESSIEAIWVNDINGDGLADLVGRTASWFEVWPGIGGGEFLEQSERFDVHATWGRIPDLRAYEVSFVDANRDGLTDVLFAAGEHLNLFTNQGSDFREVVVPAFSSVRFDVGYPVTVDLEGLGEEQAVLSRRDWDDVNRAYAVTLTTPRAGLMIRADDGRGGSIDLDYLRAPATPGINVRPPLLSRLTVRDAGTDSTTQYYDYHDPVFHSVGLHLVGYRLVRRSSSTSLAEVEFHHDDDVSGLVTAMRMSDVLSPGLPAGLYRFSSTGYEDATYRGVRHLRQVHSESGLRDASGATAAGTTSDVLEWSADGLCPAITRSTSPHGSLEQRRTRADIARLGDPIHCTVGTEIEIGSHPGRSALDFRYEAVLTRNDIGQVEHVEMRSGDSTLVAQTNLYDSFHRLHQVTRPGQGTTTVHYENDTNELLDVTSPDGVRAWVAARDATHGGMTRLVHERGIGGTFTQHVRYDGLERPARRWDSVGGDSEANPAETLTYEWASSTRPGSAVSRLLVDVSSAAYSESAELFTSGGATLATASRIPEGFSVSGLTTQTREQARRDVYHHTPIAIGDAHDITFTQLHDDAQRTWLGAVTSSVFGHLPSDERVVREGVQRRLATRLALNGGRVVRTTDENGALLGTQELDAEGRVLAVLDASGARADIQYDVLGRIVGVTLPDRTTTQTLSFDEFARPASIVHAGVGRVDYTYYATDGLLDEKRFFDARSHLVRHIEHTYDSIGRISEQRHVRASDGVSESYSYLYDGLLPDGVMLAGQQGRLTTVRGPAFDRWNVYAPDGSRSRAVLRLDNGWRTIATDYGYFEDGMVRRARRVITDADNRVLSTLERTTERDRYGRVSRVLLNNGTPRTLYEVHYDREGRVDFVELDEPTTNPAPDGGVPDAGPPDAGPRDAGPSDAGPPDAGPSDAGPSDAGPADAGPADAGPRDAGPRDAGRDSGIRFPPLKDAGRPPTDPCCNDLWCDPNCRVEVMMQGGSIASARATTVESDAPAPSARASAPAAITGTAATAAAATDPADLPELFVPQYDRVTHAPIGATHDARDWSLSYSVERNARGLIGTEHLELTRSSVTTALDREYTYDERRFVRSSTGAGSPTRYTYRPSGALSHITDASGDRTPSRTGNVLRVGPVTYRLDDFGRIIARDDLTLTYGPNGDVSRAVRASREWTFAYDETGQRILKREAGVPVAAYFDDGVYLTATMIVEPVVVMGHVVGVVVNGRYQSSATDVRGTVIADPDGTTIEVSPYGERTSHPHLAAAIDYVRSGYDEDLRVVRMGVRDFDPFLGRFRTADPLYLEDIDRCAASPTQCELFTYAGNDPVSFVDPTGLEQTACDGTESLDELLVSPAAGGGIDIYGAGSAAGANLTIAGAALQATGDDIALVAGPGGAEAVRGVGAALDLAGGAVSVPLLVADQMALEDGLDRVVSADSGAERLGAIYDTAGSLLSVSGDMASIGVGLETLGRFGVPALRGFTAGPAAPYIAGASAAYTVGTGVGRELLVPALDSEAQRYGYETHAQAGGDFIQAAVDGEFTLGEFVEFVIFDYYNPFSD